MNPIKARILCFLLLSIIAFKISGQENTQTDDWEEVLEQLSTDDDESHNWENEIEKLLDLQQQPINLNSATKEELERIPFLSDIQVENILAYVYIHGQMQTIYELKMVDEMDYQTIQRLIPFVCVQQVKEKETFPAIRNIIKYGKNELTTRVDIPFYKRKGYKTASASDNIYLGHPMYHSLRYNFRYRDNLYVGLTAEKDAGEPLFALHNKTGYDSYSFYFYLRNIRKLKTLALGNYRLSFGQGLVISNDFVMGKTTTSSTIFSRNSGIKKHSSTDEYNYFRGIAATYNVGHFNISGFYSHRSLDGIATETSITSINKTGFHRTEREAGRRGVFDLQMAGGNIVYSEGNLKIGSTGIYYFFDRPYEPQVREYSKYNLRGNNFYNLSLDYKYRWRRFTFLGEVATDKNQNIATLNAASYSPVYGYQFLLIHRFYEYNYWAHFARSFSEGGYVQNENGWYLAAELAPVKYWKFFVSADFFSFPWKKYLVDKPSQGMDIALQATFTPNKKLTMYTRYRYKKKDKNYTDKTGIKTVQPLYRHQGRYQVKYIASNNLSLRTTLDYNYIYPTKRTESRGYQIVQAVTYAFTSIPLRMELQGSYFNTNDYDSRVYAYEKGLLYTLYTPSYYGKGSRISTHIRLDINKRLMLICKYGLTIYYDRNEIGSGQDVISGSRKSDLQLQLRVKF